MLRQYSIAAACCALLLVVSPRLASATTAVGWTDWTSATPSSGTTPGSATGTMSFGSTVVTVNYSGELDANTETNGAGTNYITPTGTYASATVPNVPPGGNLITVTGGTGITDTVTFSSPVHDFLMAFVSLGTPDLAVTYQFNVTTPISILSTGTGWWGGDINLASGNTLSGLDTITGQESDGVIQFTGDFSSISWTIPPPGEYWDGWTFGAISASPQGTVGIGSTGSAVPLPAAVSTSLAMLTALAGITLFRKTRKTA